ncbi:MAG: hypothetical protein K6F33_13160 [Bacteroidales bacterium]|nr:hypothetical protein [Bacteroidales bacterium]
MKINNTVRVTAICVILITIFACGAFKQCDEIGNDFYNFLKNKQYDQALQLLDEEALKVTPQQVWLDGLKVKEQQLGLLLSVQRQDFESHTVDNVTRLAIKYKTQYTKGVMYERLEFIERNDDFKITFYRYNADSTLVE